MAEKLYGLSHLSSLAGGSEEFVNSMIETFLEHTPGQLQELVEAHKRHDMETVGGIAHKIKPNIDLFEIEKIRGDIRTVEGKGKAGVDDSELADAVKQVEEVLKLTFEQLRAR